jgi:hypothetical protein
MRSINWDKALSEEDIAWLHTTGQPGIEERIQRHQDQHKASVPELDVPEDTVSRDALDPTTRAAEPVNTGNGPQLVDPTDNEIADIEGDDYENWSKSELETEVTARNDMPDTGSVTVTGTGKDGAVLKADLVKGLRLWDQEHPDAL